MSFRQPSLDDQMQLNIAIIEKRQSRQPFHLITLPTAAFASGMVYFEQGQRTFAGDNPCAGCFVIHNNWIVSKEAKVLRFREHLMWTLDVDGYYSDASRKYIEFDNPFAFAAPAVTWWSELVALRSALAIGRVLNRVVILPSFHCPNSNRTFCALNSFFRVAKFDAVFSGRYREHVFLRNPRVPQSVRESRSALCRIRTAIALSETPELPETADDVKQFVPADVVNGATSDEIRRWFGAVSESVLRFHSLYGAFGSFTDKAEQATFMKLASEAFTPAEYRQY